MNFENLVYSYSANSNKLTSVSDNTINIVFPRTRVDLARGYNNGNKQVTIMRTI